MKKVLICSIDNENLNNFEPIVHESQNKFDYTFFDLSNFHKNTINYKQPDIKKRKSKIQIDKPFYLLNVFKRLFTSILFAIEVSKIKEKYDIVICGRIGIIEYIIIKHFKKSGAKAFSINDSILIYHEQRSLFKKIRLAIYGFTTRQNICDKIFVSGLISKNTLIKDGVSENKIIVTGLPRFAKYFKNTSIVNENNITQKVLILTGAHKWNGYFEWQKDQEKFLKKINQLPQSQYEINVKPHPRDTFDFSTVKNLNILPKNSKIDEEIINNDIIISVTSVSTGLIQAGWLSKKVLFIRSRNLSYLMDNFLFFLSEFPSVRLQDFSVDSLLKASLPDNKILDMYISKKSLDSSEIILNEINK
jgi:hypothetical protein